MISASINRKRGRDVADEAGPENCEKVGSLSYTIVIRPTLSNHFKKLRCSAGQEQSNAHILMPSVSTITTSARISSGEDDSVSSNVSEPSSSDTDMDMDMDTSSDSRMLFSQSPEQSTSWLLRNSPIRNPRMVLDDRGTRVPTPIFHTATRPQPVPVQMPMDHLGHPPTPSIARSHLTHVTERFPSPISEDEPHTPTTAAGSQLSLLTVTDVDMTMDPPEPPGQPEPMTVRKQRQRSGAFTSPREPSRKFTMGYREDCDKCRNRVPGHMNHFLGS